MPLKMRLTLLAASASLFSLAHGAQAQNIVQDGGFESAATGFYDEPASLGDGWKVTAGTDIVSSSAGRSHTGTHFLIFGFTSSGGLQQILNTTPGGTYDLSFWLRNADPNFFPPYPVSVNWNGVDVTGSPFTGPLGSYGQFIVSGLLATNATTALTLSVTNIQQTVFLDDVRVSAGVPEPGAVALICGLGVSAGPLASPDGADDGNRRISTEQTRCPCGTPQSGGRYFQNRRHASRAPKSMKIL